MYFAGKVGPDHVFVKIAAIAELPSRFGQFHIVAFYNNKDKKENVCSKPSWTTPEELTAAILYLLSDAAKTVNGAKIPLYGSF